MARLVTVLLSLFVGTNGLCYFPLEFQGEFVTQSIMSGGVPSISYSSLSVKPDSIPVWGVCHRRIGSNVVLREDTGGVTCYKCFNLVLRSSNVLQIHTSALDKCYTTEERAVEDCPTDWAIREKRSREIMLYRTKGFMGEPAVSPTYCPINGAYSFSYSINDGSSQGLECESGQASEIADCPYGFGFNLKFRQCSFGNMDMSFHCLGDWAGPDGSRYVALMDTQAATREFTEDSNGLIVEENVVGRPRYRCALYTEDDETGLIQLALSSDSTCTNHLRTPTDGYETLTMRPRPLEAWPSHLQYRAVEGLVGGSCMLPDWAQGKWEHLHVSGGNLILKDHRDFKTYTARCVGQKSRRHEERFLIFARTQCGEEHYKCVWIKNRGNNAMEFQIGLYTSNVHNESLCDSSNFLERTWVTQGRTEVIEPTPYPIVGEYTGVIPETDGLCAKLYSDCNNPEIMFYTIFNCFNRSEVFEEREYRCLGEWTEDGEIYTYTERRDMIGYECFVGVVTAKGDLYLREAGVNCERGKEPLRHGMRMTQVSKCYGSQHPRIRWRYSDNVVSTGSSSSSSSSGRKATALPRWRERQLNGELPLSGAATLSLSSLLVAVVVVLLC